MELLCSKAGKGTKTQKGGADPEARFPFQVPCQVPFDPFWGSQESPWLEVLSDSANFLLVCLAKRAEACCLRWMLWRSPEASSPSKGKLAPRLSFAPLLILPY